MDKSEIEMYVRVIKDDWQKLKARRDECHAIENRIKVHRAFLQMAGQDTAKLLGEEINNL